MQASPSTLAARQAALEILQQVIDRRRSLDEVLAQSFTQNPLSDRDRHFARAMVMMVLRRLGQIDALLEQFIDRPLPAKLWQVHHVLRLGVAQLLWLDVPDHAAVHASVELVAHIGFHSHKGFVNAILQRTVREGQQAAAAQSASKLNTPSWLWQNWEHHYGEGLAHAIAISHLHPPPLDISVKADRGKWAQTLGGMILPTGSIRLQDAGTISSLPGFQEGAWWVQDAAATLPAQLLGDVYGKHVVDLCAAPGGKTLQLAAAGAEVTAVDRSANRMESLRKNLERLQLRAHSQVMDALTFRPKQPIDAILLDAPCSATGTLRRHPDVAWHRTEHDVTRLVTAQRLLLTHALDILPPGGVLVYSVCSLQPEEGEKQLNHLLNEHRNVRLIPITAAEVGDCQEFITARGELRTLPCHWPDKGGLDGFYAMRLQKL